MLVRSLLIVEFFRVCLAEDLRLLVAGICYILGRRIRRAERLIASFILKTGCLIICIVYILIARDTSTKYPSVYLAFKLMIVIIHIVLLFVFIYEGGSAGLTSIHRGEGY